MQASRLYGGVDVDVALVSHRQPWIGERGGVRSREGWGTSYMIYPSATTVC